MRTKAGRSCVVCYWCLCKTTEREEGTKNAGCARREGGGDKPGRRRLSLCVRAAGEAPLQRCAAGGREGRPLVIFGCAATWMRGEWGRLCVCTYKQSGGPRTWAPAPGAAGGRRAALKQAAGRAGGRGGRAAARRRDAVAQSAQRRCLFERGCAREQRGVSVLAVAALRQRHIQQQRQRDISRSGALSARVSPLFQPLCWLLPLTLGLSISSCTLAMSFSAITLTSSPSDSCCTGCGCGGVVSGGCRRRRRQKSGARRSGAARRRRRAMHFERLLQLLCALAHRLDEHHPQGVVLDLAGLHPVFVSVCSACRKA